MKKFTTGLAIAAVLFSQSLLCLSAQASDRPKLVLVLVIDQFRADYLMRFQSLFKSGGFQYLMSKGAYYPYAEYGILQCMTGPGHATILTGSYPYLAGIPANDWYDQQTHSRMYCTEDPAQATVGVEKTKAHVGTSPKNLNASTVGDELKNAGYPSRVVSIAVKDRAAILMGGHRSDVSVWLDQESFRWVSSKFYLPDGKLPNWIIKLNEGLAKNTGKTLDWNIQGAGSGLSLQDPMMLKDAWNTLAGTDFPHHVPANTKGALKMPYGLEITETAAEGALDEYKLGNGKATDLLAVSFSSHDYASHAFGPNSREMEEMTIADDRVIAKLLNAVSKKVPGGLKNVVIVLTGDHGVAPNPSYLSTVKVDAGRVDVAALNHLAETALVEKFGAPKTGNWISYNADFNFYLNQDLIRDKKLNDSEVEEVVKKTFKGYPGIAAVFTGSEYREKRLPTGLHERAILKTYYPGRSGNIIAILAPNYIGLGDTADHITDYSYDRTVPLIFAGPHIKAGKYSQKADVIDIAPTLSYLLGTVPPNMSEGRVLSEMITQ